MYVNTSWRQENRYNYLLAIATEWTPERLHQT